MREQNVKKLIEKNINWNTDVIKWYLNNDSFPDFCWFNWSSVLCAFSNWFWWFLSISSTSNNEFSWLLKRWNIYYQIDNNNNNNIFKLFNNDKNHTNQCSNFQNYIDKTDKNWDWLLDITIYNSKCFLETYLRTKKYNTNIYIYEYSKQYSEEEWLDWITWTWEYWTHISDIVKTINSDWTINYSVIWKNWKIIFKESNLHWLSLIDLDKNWYKDIITFEKYKSNNWIEYKLLNIYQYDTENQKYNLNLNNIDATSIKNSDLNWDWKEDLVIQRLDWRSYIYTNKWFVEWFVQNNEIEWDRFELIDIDWDWNKDLISFKFFWWSQDYWTYNIFLKRWMNFEKINDSEWFIWNNLKSWKEKCWINDYITFYIEKQWKRKYIYFNHTEWKYKWIETVPLLNNDDNFFWCYWWFVEYKKNDVDQRWYLIFRDNVFKNMLDNYMWFVYFWYRSGNDRNYRNWEFVPYTWTTPTFLFQQNSHWTKLNYIWNVVNLLWNKNVNVTKSPNWFPVSDSIWYVTWLRNWKYISTALVRWRWWSITDHQTDLLNKYMMNWNKFWYLNWETLIYYKLNRQNVWCKTLFVWKIDSFNWTWNFSSINLFKRWELYNIDRCSRVRIQSNEYASTPLSTYEKYKKYADDLKSWQWFQWYSDNDLAKKTFAWAFEKALKQ